MSSIHPTLTQALVNGLIMPLADVRLSLAHPIFVTSFGVYESLLVEGGRIFHLVDHLERLSHSARLIGLEFTCPTADLHDWALRLVDVLPPLAYTLQILAIGPHESKADPTIAFIPKPRVVYDSQLFEQGAAAISFAGTRFLPQSKAMNTLVNHLSRQTAEQQGVLEAILTADGYLLEGARSNLFVVQAETKQLLTPPNSQVLSGVTREIVIRLMRAADYPVYEAEIAPDTPIAEMFITSTSMHVMPVTCFNGQPVGDGAVGPVTQQARDRFEEYYRRYFA